MNGQLSVPGQKPLNPYFFEIDGGGWEPEKRTPKQIERDRVIGEQIRNASFVDLFINQSAFEVPPHLRDDDDNDN